MFKKKKELKQQNSAVEMSDNREQEPTQSAQQPSHADEKEMEPVEQEEKKEAESEDMTEEPSQPANDEIEKENEEKLTVEEAYCLGAGISKEDWQKARALMGEIAETVNSGRFSPETISQAMKLMRYEQEIEEARKEGIEIGRSERLTAIFQKKVTGAAEAAAIPHLQGTKGMGTPTAGESIFDVARKAH